MLLRLLRRCDFAYCPRARVRKGGLEKGAEAYAYMRLDEAGQDFQKAVEADPHSAKAQLSLGVIYLHQYQNGVAEQHDPLRVPDESGRVRPLTDAEIEAEAEKERAQISEQNATN